MTSITPDFLKKWRSGFASEGKFSGWSAFPPRNHWRRYFLGNIVTTGSIWCAAAAYMVLVAPSYTSHWTFILPGSGAGSSLSLESVGQASSLAASPFSSPSLSPKVIYKEIINSDQVVSAAARSLGMTAGQYGKPTVKLIDETALMLFEISARTPDGARAKAESLITAFEAQLDVLRRDEIERRAISVRETLQGYKTNLRAASERIHELQEATGLVSADQFTSAAATVDILRRRIADLNAELARRGAETARLAGRLGLTPEIASIALALAADPVFNKALGDYADADAAISGQASWVGAKNPAMQRDASRRDAAFARLSAAAASAGLAATQHLPTLILVLNSKSREELLKAMVLGESELEGKTQELAELQRDFVKTQARVKDMTGQAAQLENLKKDHLVAEAVFTSALARLDTSKADLYASYPIFQVLAQPDLPESKTQPRGTLAIAGGLVGTVLGTLSWIMAWLRQLFVRKQKKSALSGMPSSTHGHFGLQAGSIL